MPVMHVESHFRRRTRVKKSRACQHRNQLVRIVRPTNCARDVLVATSPDCSVGRITGCEVPKFFHDSAGQTVGQFVGQIEPFGRQHFMDCVGQI